MGQSIHYRRIGLVIIILTTIFYSSTSYPAAEPGTILINEIMYHPTQPDSTNEWIELYNPTQDPMDLSGWTITDSSETDTIASDPDHGPGTATIPPGGYALLTDHGTTIDDFYTIPQETIRLVVDDSTLCGSGLNNQHEPLTLTDNEGTIIDCIEYGTDYEDIPGTPAPAIPQGHSLARTTGQDTDDTQADFTDCAAPTPGIANTPTTPPPSEHPVEEARVVLTELYYNTHPRVHNEYVAVTNPNNITLDISGWYITDQPEEQREDQAKVIFPPGSMIPANTTWILTQNATWFAWETGRLPTYEYEDDSRPDILQLSCEKTLSMSNDGIITLNKPAGEIIDVVVYGNASLDFEPYWTGLSVPDVGQGVILKRLVSSGIPIDTNTSADWLHPRMYHIGQSEFTAKTIQTQGQVVAFASPDCSYSIIASILRNTTQSIVLNVYEFTSVSLAEELLGVMQRQVNVSLLLDGSPVGGISEDEQSICAVLQAAGAHIRFLETNESRDIYSRYRFDHAKYLVSDNQTVVLTSGNWGLSGIPSDASYGNREWGVAITDPDLASFFMSVFVDDFNRLRSDSIPLDDMGFPAGPEELPGQFTPIGSYQPGFSPFQAFDDCRITPLLSPDTSEVGICHAIENATESIYVQQLEFAVFWDGQESPFLALLKAKAEEGLDVRVILNTDPSFDSSSVEEFRAAVNGTGIQLHATPEMPFATIHNKGMIIDNHTVLVSSVNWNENSVRRNREAAVLIENDGVAQYFSSIFVNDWNWKPPAQSLGASWGDLKYLVLIVVVVTVTAVFIAYDWRRRRW